MKHLFRRFLCAALALLISLTSALAYARLEIGDEGSEVLAMQKALKTLGYSIATDGDFGYATQQVVKSFQRKHGLQVDGIAGNATLSLLYSLAGVTDKNDNAAQSPGQDAPGVSSPSLSGGFTATLKTKGNDVTMRLSADASSQAVGSIPNGTVLTVYKQEGAWCFTMYKGVGGYIPAHFLQIGTPAPTKAPTPTPTSSGSSSSGSASGITARVSTVSGSLNLRKKATGGNNIIGSIPNHAYVVVTSKGTEWCGVTYNGMSGYVMTKFLSFDLATPSKAPAVTPTVSPTPLPTPTPGPSMDAANVYATVITTGGKLNMRSKASGGNNIIALIPNGARIQVLARGPEWCQVVYNNKTGYVMSSFLSFSAPATATPSPTPLPSATPTQAPTPTNQPTQQPSGSSAVTATVYTGNGDLNMRSSASTGNNIIDTIPDGALITVLARGNVWSVVSYRGQTGYVMSSYLRFGTATPLPTLAPPTQAPIQQPEQSGGVYAIVNTTGGSLNLRVSPQSDATILDEIPNNTRITVTAWGNTWCAVYYMGISGYVMTSFLYFPSSQVTPTPTPVITAPPASSDSLIACVTTSGGTLNLRDLPSTKGSIIYRIPNGSPVTVTNRGSSWCAITYNGISGHVMTSFLTFITTNTATPSPSPTPSQAPDNGSGSGSGNTGTTVSSYATVTTSGGTLNLRAETSKSAKILTTINYGETVMVHQIGTEWCAVSYGGFSGYVMTQYLTFMANPPATEDPDTPSDPSQYKRTLKKGMIGDDVDWVQNRLIELKYALSATGVYDDQTIAAVKHFQSQNALSTDGLAGSQTFSMLRSSNARKATDPPLNYDTLRVDDKGEAVRSMQQALKALGYHVNINGEFDEYTHNAVVAFQQRNGLVISGIADSLTRQIIHSDDAKPYSTPVELLPPDEGKIAGPTREQMQLLHWQDDIKPNVKTGQTFLIFDPNTNISWNLKFYALGRHADSQPATWRDTQLMNRSFGSTSWTIHPVYVLLPTGQWTMATMHNMPHLYGSINDNGFGGHLCVHFLRDMDEAKRNDPNYGVKNQNTLRSAWYALTGETIDR